MLTPGSSFSHPAVDLTALEHVLSWPGTNCSELEDFVVKAGSPSSAKGLGHGAAVQAAEAPHARRPPFTTAGPRSLPFEVALLALCFS